MRTSNAGDAQAAGSAARGWLRSVGALARTRSRWVWAGAALLVLVAIAAFSLGKISTPASDTQPLLAYVALPPHARLVWYDNHLDVRVKDWNYAVPGATNVSLTAFYQAQLPRDGWQCIRTTTSTDITRNGQAYSGTSVYITALRGNVKAQIYTADQGYGGYLLQGDLPPGAIALRITLVIEDNARCA